jgi:hypothetical protein
MSEYVWAAFGIAALAFLASRAARIWLDAGRWPFDTASRLGWALWGGVAPVPWV